MASEIVLPQWGMEMQDGTIVRWLKQEGDTVAEGEPIVEVETAKLQTELESTAAGILSRIVAQEGEIVPIRGVLCVIAEPGEELAPSAAPAAPANASTGTAMQTTPASNGAGAIGVQVVPAARRLARDRGLDLASVRGSGPSGRILLADVEAALRAPAAPASDGAGEAVGRVPVVPAARRLARENGIDLATVAGSGPQGRILIEDVEAAIAARSAPAAVPATDGVVPLTGIRGAVAVRMLQSLQTTAQVTLTTEAIVTEAMQLRRGLSRHHAESGGREHRAATGGGEGHCRSAQTASADERYRDDLGGWRGAGADAVGDQHRAGRSAGGGAGDAGDSRGRREVGGAAGR